ncbi:hypothetical protein [Actinoplanes sp. HUAS TT8]|uniref:hypothetical protein n=1 Tax=Actinoplanes sp. HUAS TT8 TaxID=3447453 RepID=UPI003F51C6CE
MATVAGLHLSVRQQHDPAAGRSTAALTLIGTDQLTAIGQHPAPSAAVIIAGTGMSPASAETAGRALPVIWLPRNKQRLIRLFDDTAAPVIERLRAAGYRLGFADPPRRQAGYVTPLTVTDWRRHPEQAVYVNCGRVACGDASPGLAHVVQRSNFRSLHRRFPDVWTDTVARDVTELGAFVADLPAAAIDALSALPGPQAILDNDDHQALRTEDIAESWTGLASIDVHSQLRPACRQVWDRTPPHRVTALLWEVVAATGVGPVHDGWQVRWPIAELAPMLAARLMADHRRSRPGSPYRSIASPDHATRHRYARTDRRGS